MTPDIRFVYFDLDDTLLDHVQAEHAALRDLLTRHPEAFGPNSIETVLARYHTVNSTVWAEYAAGTRTKDGAKYGRFEWLLTELEGGDPSWATHLGDAYLTAYEDHWDWIDGARAAYAHVARRLPVGLLTNGFSEIQRKKLARFPELGSLATHVVISEEVGMLKPDPGLFAHAEALAGVAADEVLYVGDSRRSDVEGGLGAGWQVAWFRGDDHPSDSVWSFHDWEVFSAAFG